jgi:hypothetical protein
MRTIVGPIVLSILMTGISGCSWLNKPYLYGNDSCGEGKTAYVYLNGHSAICLSEKSVAYIVCARELGVISDKKDSSIKSDITIPIGNIKPEIGVNVSDEVKILYASEGKLAEARANALQTCVDIYNTYK